MSEPSKTKEPQYDVLFDVKATHGVSRLGLMINQGWHDDPKRLAFSKSAARTRSERGSCNKLSAR